MRNTMLKRYILLLFFIILQNLLLCQAQETSGGTMPVTISNCKFTYGLLNYKGCYGAAENGAVICIGQYQFRQSIDNDNMVTTSQIFIKKNGLIMPKPCESKIIREDW